MFARKIESLIITLFLISYIPLVKSSTNSLGTLSKGMQTHGLHFISPIHFLDIKCILDFSFKKYCLLLVTHCLVLLNLALIIFSGSC